MKRVLLVTYYFPPAGGAPVQRVLKWTRYLPEFGWQPYVLTVANGAFPSRDETLVDHIPKDVEVIRTRAWNPHGWYARVTGKTDEEAVGMAFASDRPIDWREKTARWIRSTLFLPDARVGWVPFARNEGKKLVASAGIDAMISSGPPHSTHLAALGIKRSAEIPWIADFRDPWNESHYLAALPESKWSKRRNLKMERCVLHYADLVTTVSPTWSRLLENKSDLTPVAVIHNGYDEPDFAGVEPGSSGRFVVAYSGNMAPEQNPTAFWEALAAGIGRGEFPDLELLFIGEQDLSLRRDLDRFGLLDRAVFTGQVSHQEAIRHMASASVLLLVLNRVDTPTAPGIITTKFYEYLRIGLPLLAIGGKQADIEQMISETTGGSFFEHSDSEGMMTYLGSRYDAWIRGEPSPRASSSLIRRYSREESTRQLAEYLSSLSRTGAP